MLATLQNIHLYQTHTYNLCTKQRKRLPILVNSKHLTVLAFEL